MCSFHLLQFFRKVFTLHMLTHTHTRVAARLNTVSSTYQLLRKKSVEYCHFNNEI